MNKTSFSKRESETIWGNVTYNLYENLSFINSLKVLSLSFFQNQICKGGEKYHMSLFMYCIDICEEVRANIHLTTILVNKDTLRR